MYNFEISVVLLTTVILVNGIKLISETNENEKQIFKRQLIEYFTRNSKFLKVFSGQNFHEPLANKFLEDDSGYSGYPISNDGQGGFQSSTLPLEDNKFSYTYDDEYENFEDEFYNADYNENLDDYEIVYQINDNDNSYIVKDSVAIDLMPNMTEFSKEETKHEDIYQTTQFNTEVTNDPQISDDGSTSEFLDKVENSTECLELDTTLKVSEAETINLTSEQEDNEKYTITTNKNEEANNEKSTTEFQGKIKTITEYPETVTTLHKFDSDTIIPTSEEQENVEVTTITKNNNNELNNEKLTTIYLSVTIKSTSQEEGNEETTIITDSNNDEIGNETLYSESQDKVETATELLEIETTASIVDSNQTSTVIINKNDDIVNNFMDSSLKMNGEYDVSPLGVEKTTISDKNTETSILPITSNSNEVNSFVSNNSITINTKYNNDIGKSEQETFVNNRSGNQTNTITIIRSKDGMNKNLSKNSRKIDTVNENNTEETNLEINVDNFKANNSRGNKITDSKLENSIDNIFISKNIGIHEEEQKKSMDYRINTAFQTTTPTSSTLVQTTDGNNKLQNIFNFMELLHSLEKNATSGTKEKNNFNKVQLKGHSKHGTNRVNVRSQNNTRKVDDYNNMDGFNTILAFLSKIRRALANISINTFRPPVKSALPTLPRFFPEYHKNTMTGQRGNNRKNPRKFPKNNVVVTPPNLNSEDHNEFVTPRVQDIKALVDFLNNFGKKK